jgi:predicted ester cyclase
VEEASGTGGSGLRYRYVVRISEADVGQRVVVRWRRPVVAGPDEVADALGILESADGGAFAVRDRHGNLIVIPRERAMAARVVPHHGKERHGGRAMSSVVDANKAVVRRLVGEVFNGGRMDVVDALYSPELAPAAKRWIAPFRAAFPDVHLEIVELIAEGDKVAGRFSCSGTHQGTWRGHPATGRRFERIAEVYIFQFRDGRIVGAWGLEDTLRRLQQLGLA